MTAHILNVLVFLYCFNNCPNYSLDGLILMAIDNFTMYTVYKVFYCIISKLDNSYSNNWGKQAFQNSHSMKLIK